ncbi:MAG: chemotaxis protein CheW [Oscillospiraceae bacterium]
MNEIETVAVKDPILNNDMPWLVFEAKNQHFAVNSASIVTILQLNQKVTIMPDYPPNVRGVINFRGDIVPLLELRKVIGLKSFIEEEKEFDDMLEQRKTDHIHWADELERCIDAKENFTLATDPHKCAFGKWYYNYKTDSQAVSFVLGKIEEPHKLLHETAENAMACERHCDTCKLAECKQAALHKAKNMYVPTVLSLIDDAKEIFKASNHEMCIILTNGAIQIGLLVDAVDSVVSLEFMGDGGNFGGTYKSNFVESVAKSSEISTDILVLREDALFESIND